MVDYIIWHVFLMVIFILPSIKTSLLFAILYVFFSGVPMGRGIVTAFNNPPMNWWAIAGRPFGTKNNIINDLRTKVNKHLISKIVYPCS
jgi:hypothetical protein